VLFKTLWAYHKKFNQLSFFEVVDSGHMALADKLAEILEMLQRWMTEEL
jgi:carboxypeptidase C (cathepsin A)